MFETFQVQNDYDILGYSAALGGTLLTASNFVCMRKLREVHFSVLIFAFSVMSAVMSAAIVGSLATFRIPDSAEEWTYSVLVGVFGLFGQALLAMALRLVSRKHINADMCAIMDPLGQTPQSR